jgi:hypothetical protein
MKRFCYCSKVLPGCSDAVRAHWKNKPASREIDLQEEAFWDHLKMTGFDSWLQKRADGDWIVHCLEGQALELIFKGLREKIAAQNPVACSLQKFYKDVLGKEYASVEAEPQLELLFDLGFDSPQGMKQAFFFSIDTTFQKPGPLEIKICMEQYDLFHLSSWLQTTADQKYCIVYLQSRFFLDSLEGLAQKMGCSLSETISTNEWLTQSSEVSLSK